MCAMYVVCGVCVCGDVCALPVPVKARGLCFLPPSLSLELSDGAKQAGYEALADSAYQRPSTADFLHGSCGFELRSRRLHRTHWAASLDPFGSFSKTYPVHFYATGLLTCF